MAQISKPPIPLKMYRHFAIVTVCLTACLALFAQGENAEYERAQRPVASRPSATPSASATPRYGQAQLNVAPGAAEGSFGEENVSRPSGYRGAVSRTGQLLNTSNLPMAGSENAGFTREYLDSLSDEELAELLRQLRAGGVEDADKRAQALQVMEAASRRRSGRATAME